MKTNPIHRDQKMKPIYDRYNNKWKYLPDEGWDNLLLELHCDLILMDPEYTLSDAKEKFGGLRYYVEHKHNDKCNPDPDHPFMNCDFYNRIHAAEIKSYTICEKCGEPGTTGGDGWIKTLCEEHKKEQ